MLDMHQVHGVAEVIATANPGASDRFKIALAIAAVAVQEIELSNLLEALSRLETFEGFARRTSRLPAVGRRADLFMGFFDDASNQVEWGAGDLGFDQGESRALLFRSKEGYKCCVLRHAGRDLPPFGPKNTVAVAPGTVIPTDSWGVVAVTDRPAMRDTAAEMRRALKWLAQHECHHLQVKVA